MNSLFPLLLVQLCCGGVFFAAFVGGGLFALYQARKVHQQTTHSAHWPTTNGTITETHIHTHHADGARYTPRVTYTYRVGEVDYTSNTITLGFAQTFSRRAPAEAWLTQYPVGQTVTVYYDPANPAQAMLARKATGAQASYIVGGALVAVGLCLACPLFIAALFTVAQLLGNE